MKKFILLTLLALSMSANALAHQAFTLVSSAKRSVTLADLIAMDKERTLGKKDGLNLTFTEKEIRIVVVTGPADDMLSYRVQGVRNPNFIVPSGATLKILFVNKDTDMKHDIRFGHVTKDFEIIADTAETAGSEKLTAKSDDDVYQAQELVIKATEDGAYKYFCSVDGHAKGGMWGNILVGITSTKDLKTAPKTEHVHSPDEDKDHPGDMKDMKMDKKPDEKMSDMSGMKSAEKPHDMSNMKGMNHSKMPMASTVNLNDPMTRESSGTAWVPDSSPVYARMKMYENGGMLMLMGGGFVRYTSVGSSRDVSVAGKGKRARFDAPTMFMAMYSRPLTKKSQIGFRVMASLDPVIQRGYGYPLLYQSGELYKGKPIHDRQHPHDFFSELAVTYSYKFNKKNSVYFYAGYPGEPALGPPTFMHRLSAMNNPDAPISHHWQDSSHITWGVLTAGYSFGKFKIEASAFKGEEPDENRWNFDKPKLNSYSGRASFNPTKEWAFQISHGVLKNPEPGEPDLKILRRTTASGIYNKKISDDKNFAGTFVWGQNYGNGERTNSFLFESNYDFDENAIFGRLERVQKSGHELVLNHPDDHQVFNVGAYSIGYLRDLVKDRGLDMGLGAMITINQNPSSLSSYYGGTTHGGWQIFMRFRPSKLK